METGPVSLSRLLPVVKYSWPGDGDNGEEVVQSSEVVGVGGEEGEAFGDGDSGDHQVGDPTPWFASTADPGRADPAMDTGCFRVEGDGVELVLGALEDVHPPGAFSALVVIVLFLVPADFVRTRGQLGQGDGADRDLGGKLVGIDPPAQDHHIGVEESLCVFNGHRGRPAPAGQWSPGRRGTLPERCPGRGGTWPRTPRAGRSADVAAAGPARRCGVRPG